MRAKELIALLTQKEEREFRIKLKKHARASLYELYRELFKHKDASKEMLFAAFAKKRYRKEYDYLLRNELRLLSKEVEIFITEQEARNRFANNDIGVGLWLLERLLTNNKFHEFELEWNERVKVAEQKVDVLSIKLLLKMYSEYRLKYGEINSAEIGLHFSILKTYEEAAQCQLAEELSEAEVTKNFLIANRKAIKAKVANPKQEIVSLPLTQWKQAVEYNRLKAKCYLMHGNEKINALIDLSKRFVKTVKFRNYSPHELSNVYGNIGLSYFLQKNYVKAHQYYKKAVAEANDKTPNLGLLYNYAINSMMLGKYKAMQNIYFNYKEDIEKSEKTRHRFRYFTAISLLFENNYEKAFRLLESDLSKKAPHEYYYYRIVYAMVFFDSGEYFLAERELNNILQSIRKNKNDVIEDKPLLMIFLHLVQAASSYGNRKSYSQKLSVISEQLAAFQKEQNNFSVIVYKWLLMKI